MTIETTINKLPVEIISEILSHVGAHTQLTSSVSKLFKEATERSLNEHYETYLNSPTLSIYVPRIEGNPTPDQRIKAVKDAYKLATNGSTEKPSPFDIRHMNRTLEVLKALNLNRFYEKIIPLIYLPEGQGRAALEGLNSIERAQTIRTWMEEHQEFFADCTSLHLNETQLTAIPPEIRYFTNLQQLFLQDNQIAFLSPDEFAGLTNLKLLCLKENQIAVLPSGVFAGLPNLQLLYLENNKITVLPPDVFANLPNLQMLSLKGNEIAVLPHNVFAGLTNLESLYLEWNKIAVLAPNVFTDLTNLKVLCLQRNKIAVLPHNVFAGLTNLIYLSLEANKISVLPPNVFAGLRRLHELYLSGNKISDQPPNVFEGLPNLGKLHLEYNQTSDRPPGLFTGPPNLQTPSIVDNPEI